MHIAIHTASGAVRRTLEAAALAAGHTLAACDAPNADLVLIDAIHRSTAPVPAASSCLSFTTASSDSREISCPVHPAQLIQKLRYVREVGSASFSHGWSLDATARMLVHSSGKSLSLTEKESELMAKLAGATDQRASRELLLSSIWGMSDEVDTHTLETHIYRLRGKLAELTPPIGDILTEEGSYRLVAANA